MGSRTALSEIIAMVATMGHNSNEKIRHDMKASGIVSFSDALTFDQEAGRVAVGRGETGEIGSK